MQNDGNLVEYDRGTYKAIWWSGTQKDVAEENVPISKAAKQCFTSAPSAAPLANPTPNPSTAPTIAPSPIPTHSPSRWTNVFVNELPYSQNSGHYPVEGNDLIALTNAESGPSCTQVCS